MTAERETFRIIPDCFDRYRVSNLGRVQSCMREGHRPDGTTIWRDLIPLSTGNGYLYVKIQTGRGGPSRKVHELVLTTFRGPCPAGMIARHLDGNRFNNRLSNLVWGTPLENSADTIRHDRSNRGSRNHFAKLDEAAVREIRLLYRESSLTHAEIARHYRVDPSTVCDIVNGRTWAHVNDNA